jgi:DNA-binding NarL/FixJ family response regulator
MNQGDEVGRDAVAHPPDVLTAAQWSRIIDRMRLSEREAQMAFGICCGEGEQATAERLGISRATVHTYRERLYRKVGARGAAETVARMFTIYLLNQIDGALEPDG